MGNVYFLFSIQHIFKEFEKAQPLLKVQLTCTLFDCTYGNSFILYECQIAFNSLIKTQWTNSSLKECECKYIER